MSKTTELRERTSEDLAQLVKELERDLWKCRFDNHTNQLDDTAKVSRLRRDVARIKTILGERTRSVAKG